MKRLLVAAALLGVAAPVATAAPIGSTNFGNLCGSTSRSGDVCVSGSVELYEGMLRVSVQNMQGQPGATGVPHRVTGFALYYTGDAMGPGGTLTGPVPDGGWRGGVHASYANPGPDGGPWTWLLGAYTQGNGGMYGCDEVGSGAVPSCDGPLVFTFTGIDETKIRLDDLHFGFRTQSIGEGESYKCYSTNAKDAAHDCFPTDITTTPEPGTIVLLAGGLLGLGGFGFVRRRREGQG